MGFVFVCPENGKVFDSQDFKVIDNYGVKTDKDGNRYLDARVMLNSPCPYCGVHHIYPARELACPFTNED